MLSLVDGSDGESHERRSCRNWFPVRKLELARINGVGKLRTFHLVYVTSCLLNDYSCFSSVYEHHN
jgi:hypothetical protein